MQNTQRTHTTQHQKTKDWCIKKVAEDLNRHFSKEDIQMDKGHTKRCSASLIIREMQTKTTRRHHRTSARMAIIKKTTNNRYWQGCREREPLCAAGGNVNWCSHYGKQYKDSSKKKSK